MTNEQKITYNDDIAKAICVSSEIVLLEAEREIDRLKRERELLREAFLKMTTLIDHISCVSSYDFRRVVIASADELTEELGQLIK